MTAKTRQRKSYSCINCRDKKRKCDRGKPCSSCVRSGIASTCKYNTPTLTVLGPASILYDNENASSLEPEGEDDIRDFLRLKNPVGIPGGKINFFKLLCNNLIEPDYNVFSWINVYKSDPGMRIYLKNLPSNSKLFVEQVVVDDFHRDDIFKGLLNLELDELYRRSVGPDSENKIIHNEEELLLAIRSVLPNTVIIATHVEKFFSELYPGFPFLDESAFRKRLMRMGNGPRITDENDWAIIGILLIMVRISYLSSLWNISGSDRLGAVANRADYELVSSATIGPEFIRLARSCLKQYDLQSRNSLWVLQCNIFLQIYERVSPEEGECATGKSSQIIHASLIQHALSLKLHIDPDLLPQLYGKNEKYKNLVRKIWHFLVSYDYFDSISYGNYPSTTKMVFNTRLPTHIEGNENIQDTKLEKEVLGSFEFLDFTYGPVHDLLVDIQSLKTDHKIERIVFLATAIESTIASIIGQVDTFFSVETNPSTDKGIRFALFLYLKFFLLTIFSYLQSYYERTKQYETAFFYFKKVLIIGSYEILPAMFRLVGSFGDHFKKETFMLTPQIIQLSCHRLIITLVSAFIRIEITLKSNGQELSGLHGVKIKVLQILHLFLVNASALSIYVHYTWRVKKALEFALRKIFDGQLYKLQNLTELEISKAELKISKEQVADLDKALQSALLAIEKAWKPSLPIPFASIDNLDYIYGPKNRAPFEAYDRSEPDRMWYKVSSCMSNGSNSKISRNNIPNKLQLNNVEYDFNIFKGMTFVEQG
ncbi:zinc finger transcription factor [Scheffersomyces stipitis CBS 6054]|uniref:Zinc finger transcription factor n=1 Tax=Scheffersomyces stipitis (strain ATCC 58785 / CBS 6054 / NBRC 10063 / NRRL Y-11545) TaxID=322104 RepID=A3LSN5_PICST|nr:zinc finger transcription factor [Scheffersomyces stipitis CBS 6054]ABN65603.2 zinc finger transcription factor [Scheffersomyces stipitis CBS 6054]KAG2733900.1 hypothetical protein G9P44_003425 [Scheffersomyces stipitis]